LKGDDDKVPGAEDRNLIVDTTITKDIVADIKEKKGLDQLRTRIKSRLNYERFFKSSFLSHNVQIVNQQEGAWFPFEGRPGDPSTSQAYEPQNTPFTNLDEMQWGRDKQNYSSWFHDSCTLVHDKWLDRLLYTYNWGFGSSLSKSQYNWREIAILTNGVCVGSCADAATKLQFAEGATVFSFGGVPGEKMDTATGTGTGLGERYDASWPKLLYGAALGDLLAGPDTEIGRLLRSSEAQENGYKELLMRPLPTMAKVRYNYFMTFNREFSEEDSLPREFYNIPAHKHYDEWLQMGTLEKLYFLVRKENWRLLRLRARDDNTRYDCAKDPPLEAFQTNDINDWTIGLPLALFCCLLVRACGPVINCCLSLSKDVKKERAQKRRDERKRRREKAPLAQPVNESPNEMTAGLSWLSAREGEDGFASASSFGTPAPGTEAKPAVEPAERIRLGSEP